jgi:hypothetical protein
MAQLKNQGITFLFVKIVLQRKNLMEPYGHIVVTKNPDKIFLVT